jgi:hypothetical protein
MKTGDDKRNAKLAAMAVAALLIGATSAGAAQPPAPAQPQNDRRNVVTELVTVAVPPVATLPAAEMAQQRALLSAELDGLRLERTAHLALQRTELARIATLAEVADFSDFSAASADLVEITDAIDLETLRDVRVAFDRKLDIADQASWGFDFYADDQCAEAQPDNIWSSAADMVVSAARLPARAGVVVRAMLGAFAKVTPRVLRALL